jgi:hypothetical protein
MRRHARLFLALGIFLLAFAGCEIIDDTADGEDTTGGSDTVEQYCIADSWCDPDCQYDPDCGSAPDCSSDSWCNPDCAQTTDPDCAVDCTCDYNSGICEPEAKGSTTACHCDDDCIGKSPCGADSHCDTWCPSGTDPYCGSADCDQSAFFDPDCKSSGCSCDYHNNVCEMEIKNDANMKPCYCDSDCSDEYFDPCGGDSHCDTWCPSGQDPDC